MAKHIKRNGKKILEQRAIQFSKALDYSLVSLRKFRDELTDDEFSRYIEFMSQQYQFYMKRMESYRENRPEDDMVLFKF